MPRKTGRYNWRATLRGPPGFLSHRWDPRPGNGSFHLKGIIKTWWLTSKALKFSHYLLTVYWKWYNIFNCLQKHSETGHQITVAQATVEEGARGTRLYWFSWQPPPPPLNLDFTVWVKFYELCCDIFTCFQNLFLVIIIMRYGQLFNVYSCQIIFLNKLWHRLHSQTELLTSIWKVSHGNCTFCYMFQPSDNFLIWF